MLIDLATLATQITSDFSTQCMLWVRSGQMVICGMANEAAVIRLCAQYYYDCLIDLAGVSGYSYI